jgi:hypothetical protein
VAVSLYWVVLASVVPASMRPYIDGSTNNSAWSMVFDYNLFSRYETGVSGVGWRYMLESSVATQVGWLYPVALIGLALGLSGRRPRTDVVRAGFVMWGLWLAVHAVAFSEGRVAHSFYVVSVAPAVSALAGGGLVLMWRAYRRGGVRRWVLPAAVVATVAWALYLSTRFPTFMPWLTPLVAVLGAVAAGLLVLVAFVVGRPKLRARLALVAVVATLGALLAAPATWAASTVDAAYSGSSIGPAAGPVAAFGPGGGGGGGGRFPGGAPAGGVPGGAAGFAGGGPAGFAGGGGADASSLVAWLKSHQPGSRYLLAVQGSQQAGPYVLAGASVLPMGGFSGRIPFPTTDQLASLVSTGQLRYVLIGGGGRESSSTTTSWVTGNCTAVTGAPASGLYDCARS